MCEFKIAGHNYRFDNGALRIIRQERRKSIPDFDEANPFEGIEGGEERALLMILGGANKYATKYKTGEILTMEDAAERYDDMVPSDVMELVASFSSALAVRTEVKEEGEKKSTENLTS